jgi:hypothetical protein
VVRRGGKVPVGKREANGLKHNVEKLSFLIVAVLLTSACGVSFNEGNLKLEHNGSEIVSIGRDGFKLDGNVTGLKLDAEGLKIEYPNGNLSWDSEGLDITHADGSIRIAGGSMVVTDKNGKQETLDTTGEGAEYKTDGGVLVKTGEKAAIPQDYPSESVPLMEGFVMNASAQLGSVEVVSGYVKDKTADDAAAYYEPLLIKGSSFSRDKKDGSIVLRAKLDGIDVTIYLVNSLTAKAVDISIIIGQQK